VLSFVLILYFIQITVLDNYNGPVLYIVALALSSLKCMLTCSQTYQIQLVQRHRVSVAILSSVTGICIWCG
jgi:hypothetical protein